MQSKYSLSRQQRRALFRRVRKARDGAFQLRLLNVANAGAGKSLRCVADITGSSPSSVQRHAERYATSGILGLYDRREDNGEPALPDEAFGFLRGLIGHVPRDFGFRRTTWSRELMKILLAEQIGVSVSVSTVGRALRVLGLVWRRARPTLLSPYPKRVYSAFKGWITKLIKRASADEVVLYEDEADLHLNPKIGSDWMHRGQQKCVRTPGQNKRRYIAGALNAVTGNVVWVIGEKKRSNLFIELLREIRRRYRRAKTIHLILDNYSIHGSKITCAALAEYGDLFKLHFMPSYGQELNRIEHLWKQMHDNVTRNHRCKTVEELVSEVESFIEEAIPFPGAGPALNMAAS